MKTPMKTTLSVLALAISAATAVNATTLTHDVAVNNWNQDGANNHGHQKSDVNDQKSDVNDITRYHPRLDQGNQKSDVNGQKSDVSYITRYHPRLDQGNQKSDVNGQKSDVSYITRYHPRLDQGNQKSDVNYQPSRIDARMEDNRGRYSEVAVTLKRQ